MEIEPRYEKTGCFCICENKGADQLRSNCAADQLLCFRYIDSTILLNPKFQASSHRLWLYSPVCVGPGRKPRRQLFSCRASNYLIIFLFPGGHFSRHTDSIWNIMRHILFPIRNYLLFVGHGEKMLSVRTDVSLNRTRRWTVECAEANSKYPSRKLVSFHPLY